MSSLRDAASELRTLDALAAEDRWLNRIHPLAKLWLTIFYIAVVVSFGKYNLTGLLGMAIYLIFVYMIGEISLKEAIYRMRVILPIVCVVGLFNPFFDRTVVTTILGLPVTGGVLSMLTLMLKGIFTVLASYALIATTSIEKICCALRLLHVPKLLVTVLLLIYRYISVLLAEANRMVQAYSLRAPGQKGIHFKVWGSLVGQLLLRSMDRAQNVYDSMCLRGYEGEFYFGDPLRVRPADVLYPAVWTLLLLAFRWVPVFELVGSLFV